MKREHTHTSCSNHLPEKQTMWDELTQPEPEPDTGVDELLAVLGYQVKSSEMNNVAQKIQHLDHVLANDVALSQLASDSVHYNPSDLSSWLDGLVNIQPPDPFQNDVVSHNDDLQSIISPPPTKKQKLPSTGASTSHGGAWNMNNGACTMNNGACDINDDLGTRNVGACTINGGACDTNNGLGTRNVGACTINGGACTSHAPNKHIVVMDTQENGIRLVHTLMACAEAVQAADLKLAETLVSRAVMLAASQAGAMRKVALFFTEALACRIYKLNVNLSNESPLLQDLLQMHFYETCPYIKFAHFTANQAILEAFEGKEKVHVVDFSMKQGLQWPALLQALALRPGGPPTFKLTAIGPPNNNKNNININSNSNSNGNGNGNGNNNETDYLEEVGWRLKHLADTINVEFEYKRIIVKSLADIEPGMLDIREDEVVAVNSVFELHRLLARPGSVEKVLDMVREVNPVILTVVEQEANHNGAVFLERFTESLHYYSTLFDSLESSSVGSGGDVVECGGGVGGLGASEENRVMSEMYLGKQICNVVACEGVDRVERHQTWTQWKGWFDSAGYESVHLGSNAYKQASMLLALFAGGDGYRVEEHNGCLMLGWHTRPLITTSAWKLRPTR